MGSNSDSQRKDTAVEKRIELHAHTKYSRNDSVVSAEDLIGTAVNWGWEAIAITDCASVQAFFEAMKAIEWYGGKIKVIYGMEGYVTEDDYKKGPVYHVAIIVKNMVGLRNLYKLIDISSQHFCRQPRIPKHILAEHREGLLLGAVGEHGELIKAILEGKEEETLLEIARDYDFLEVYPIKHYQYIETQKILSRRRKKELFREINQRIVEIGRKTGKLVVAAGDVKYLHPQDADIREALHYNMGFRGEETGSHYLHTTEEMLKEFNYLGKETAFEIVVKNTRTIADMVEVIKPVPHGIYMPMILNLDNFREGIDFERKIEYLKEIFGYDKVYRVGRVLKRAAITADFYANRYAKYKKKAYSSDYLRYMKKSLENTKICTSINEHRVAIIPKTKEVYDYMPIQKLPDSDIVVTHFDEKVLSYYQHSFCDRDGYAVETIMKLKEWKI